MFEIFFAIGALLILGCLALCVLTGYYLKRLFTQTKKKIQESKEKRKLETINMKKVSNEYEYYQTEENKETFISIEDQILMILSNAPCPLSSKEIAECFLDDSVSIAKILCHLYCLIKEDKIEKIERREMSTDKIIVFYSIKK